MPKNVFISPAIIAREDNAISLATRCPNAKNKHESLEFLPEDKSPQIEILLVITILHAILSSTQVYRRKVQTQKNVEFRIALDFLKNSSNITLRLSGFRLGSLVVLVVHLFDDKDFMNNLANTYIFFFAWNFRQHPRINLKLRTSTLRTIVLSYDGLTLLFLQAITELLSN